MLLYCYIFTDTCIFRRSCKWRHYQLHIGHPFSLQSNTLSSIRAIELWRTRQTLWVTKLSSFKSQYFPPHSNTGLQLLPALCHRTAAFPCGTGMTVKMWMCRWPMGQPHKQSHYLGVRKSLGEQISGETWCLSWQSCVTKLYLPQSVHRINFSLENSVYMNLPPVNHPQKIPFHRKAKRTYLFSVQPTVHC